ncbi:hypothetical protein ACJJIW_16900 [Microbulbifer sp. JMSA004]|uniref:hypothetical protein n=1 Tax=Microbulbifer sp. JMSA004 TaxID=3243370 RepID=UPI004039FAA1
MLKGLPFRLNYYLERVDWSGRQLNPQKHGAIDENIPPILERLGIPAKHWSYLNRNFESRFKQLTGSAELVRRGCQRGLSHTPFKQYKNCLQSN